ncbi:enoyl-CoA hydratase-related protein [Streptomyces sp. NPDC051956]|uniref:enoyl-CoA hydratase-related protein n=1 Tax=Streptomyces sp. NPDC051956 TaxID=3365677 RepID=UPI0037CEACED
MSVVLVEYPAQGVALVRINRPDARNALNNEVRAELAAAFQAINADPAVRAVVLTGDERTFAAGADLREQADRDVVGAISTLPSRPVWECPKPVIAAVNGFAFGGGCELAMQCDIVIASDTARFAQPEIGLGIVPGGGGTQFLPRLVGRSNALYLLLTGDRIRAEEALRFGLVSEVVPGDAAKRALEIAEQIAAKPPLTARAIKNAVRAGLDAPVPVGLELERRAYESMFGTQDLKEGIASFFEKRTPEFHGE